MLPALLFLILLVDLGSRFLRIDPLTFRAWEALIRYSAPGAPFEANRDYLNEKSYGDLAAMGNLPEMRQYRRESFSTDGYGFRNDRNIGSRPIAAILVGDSFSVGSGVDGDQTLSSQLGRLIGAGVYNAAGIEPTPAALIAIADRLKMKEGAVIYEYLERNDPPAIAAPRIDPNGPPARLLRKAKNSIFGYFSVSPFQILAGRFLKRLQNDAVMPNPYSANVVEGRFVSGDEMLFLPADVMRAEKRRPVSGEYWSRLRGMLAARRLDLIVVLVPTNYTVYGAPSEAGAYLARLQEDLARRGVNALDLTPSFREEARLRLARRDYLYWLDDTHWNPEGIALAARLLQARMKPPKKGKF